MKEKQQRSIRAFLGGQAGPAPAPVASPNSSSIECLSDDCLLLVLSRLTQSQRLTTGALVCKRWRRLVTCPDVLRLGLSAAIQAPPHLERVQSLRRWLTRHAGSLHTLDIALGAPVKALPEARAAQAELSRCLAMACGAGAVRHLVVRWLAKIPLKLGPELAACGTCASVCSLVIDGGDGDVHVACPLGRLTALEHCELSGCTKWDGAASLPPSITSLVLRNVSAYGSVWMWHRELPQQLSVLSSLRQLTIDASPAVSRDGFSVLSTLTSVTRLVLHGAPAWPAVLQQLTGLRHLEVARMGSRWWWVAGQFNDVASAESAQDTLVALSALTALHLHGTVTPPPSPAVALAGAARLQLLCDRALTTVFGPDAWPDSLRCARINWKQLGGGRWAAGFGEQLRYLRIDSEWVCDWGAMQRQPAWATFWAWAAQAADLRLLEITGYSYRELPMGLTQALMALRQRRPQLRVTTRGPDYDRDAERFLATAAAFCS